MLEGYQAGLGTVTDGRYQTAFESEGMRGVHASRGTSRQSKPKGLVYDDYSDGEISLIIDEDIRVSPETEARRNAERQRNAAAREIFGEVDEQSNEGGRRGMVDRRFRIKKPLHPKTTVTQTLNSLNSTDPSKTTTGFGKLRFGDLEHNFKLNKLESRTDNNVRDRQQQYQAQDSIRRIGVENAKETLTQEKLRKQMEIERDLRTKYTSFYNSNPKEVVRSSSHNVNKVHNNFMRTNGFQAASNNEGSQEDDRSPSKNNVRNYDKPWLVNSSNREIAAATMTVESVC